MLYFKLLSQKKHGTVKYGSLAREEAVEIKVTTHMKGTSVRGCWPSTIVYLDQWKPGWIGSWRWQIFVTDLMGQMFYKLFCTTFHILSDYGHDRSDVCRNQSDLGHIKESNDPNRYLTGPVKFGSHRFELRRVAHEKYNNTRSDICIAWP